jgi:DNA-binding FadR family transcriptional regulator
MRAMTNTATLQIKTDSMESLRMELLKGLQSGSWPPGSRLPTERDLCATFGVSRSGLRRVLAELREQGLIVQKVGSGTYVAEKARSSKPDATGTGRFLAVPSVSPAELMEARLLLEPMLVDLIVNNANTADFERLEDCCARAEAAQTLDEFEKLDSELHEQLALATQNALFISVFRLMAEIRESGEWGFLKQKVLTAERRAVLQKEHRQIVAALRQRDVDTARRAIFDHLAQARLNLLWRI